MGTTPDVVHQSQWLSPEECDRYEQLFLDTVPLFRPAYTSQRHGNACVTPCYCTFYARDVHGGIPEWMAEIGTRLAQHLHLDADYFNCVIGRLYKDGKDHIEWHTDLRRNLDEDDLTIGSVSLGPQRRTFSMRRVENIWSTAAQGRSVAPRATWSHWTLGRGDMMAMQGRDTQARFEHAVLPDPKATQWRINLNFRHIRPEYMDEGCYRFYKYSVYGDTHPRVSDHLQPQHRHDTSSAVLPLEDSVYGASIVSRRPSTLFNYFSVAST